MFGHNEDSDKIQVGRQAQCDGNDSSNEPIVYHNESSDNIQVGEHTQCDGSDIFNRQTICHNEDIDKIQAGEHAQRDSSDIFSTQIICHNQDIERIRVGEHDKRVSNDICNTQTICHSGDNDNSNCEQFKHSEPFPYESKRLHVNQEKFHNENSCSETRPDDNRKYVSPNNHLKETLSHKERNSNSGLNEHETNALDVWKDYDTEFAQLLIPLHDKLTNNEIKPDEAATMFNNMLTKFLETKPTLVKEVKSFYKHKPTSMKKLEDAKKLKILLEKKARQKDATDEDKSLACQALRHYDYLLKEQKTTDEAKEKIKQEKDFRTNFYKFAKDVTNGTYGQPPVEPTFSCEEANNFYKNRYSTEVTIKYNELNWFPEVPTPHTPYDLSPYSSKDVKEALRKKNPDSAPGDDQILYGYLEKLPQTHEFLATLFTQIRDSSQAPDIWAISKIILIPKSDNTDTDEPTDFRMIALTANVAKLYHSLESSRTISFMIMNNYLDPSAQKAYIQGINGCVEHVQVVQEVIQHSKANNRTAYITWFDLVDAFGSLSHMLIPHVFRHYHIPEKIISYIQHIYSRLKGKVVTKQWKTDLFEFLKGTFQGDPFSGTAFLVAFNPLIEHIKKFKESQGYKIQEKNEESKEVTKETNIITTPFADDFNLISRNKKQHQLLITDVVNKAKSMGLCFKPSKCRSLSICNGKPKDVSFVLNSSVSENEDLIHIETIHTNPHKFLGSMITYTNTPQEYFKQLFKALSDKLENINTSKVRGEHKLAIYERYSLPSMRYHFSIHQLHETHLGKLDQLSKSYLKKWLNFPTRGVSDIGIFHPYLLKVKQPSQLYLEGHVSKMFLMRMKGDATVNACIDSKIEREKCWKKKSSTTVKSSRILVNLAAQNKIKITNQGSTREQHMKAGKVAVRQTIKDEVKEI